MEELERKDNAVPAPVCPCHPSRVHTHQHTNQQNTHTCRQRCSTGIDHLDMRKCEPAATLPAIPASGTEPAPRCAHPRKGIRQ